MMMDEIDQMYEILCRTCYGALLFALVAFVRI